MPATEELELEPMPKARHLYSARDNEQVVQHGQAGPKQPRSSLSLCPTCIGLAVQTLP